MFFFLGGAGKDKPLETAHEFRKFVQAALREDDPARVVINLGSDRAGLARLGEARHAQALPRQPLPAHRYFT